MINSVVLVGRLTKDPDVRYTSVNNTLVANYTLAVNRTYVKPGEQRQADFIPVIAWGKTGEFVSKYFKKGMQVSVVGRIQTRSWDDQNGQKRYATEVVASEVQILEAKKDGADATSQANVAETFGSVADVSQTNEFSTITDDDLPF